MTAGTAAVGLLTAVPAAAGGVGDILSPAFATYCANHRTTPHAAGATTAGTGAADGNLLGLPLGSALNQCGGADLTPQSEDVTEKVKPRTYDINNSQKADFDFTQPM